MTPSRIRATERGGLALRLPDVALVQRTGLAVVEAMSADRCGRSLLRRPASEAGRLRHGNEAHEGATAAGGREGVELGCPLTAKAGRF